MRLRTAKKILKKVRRDPDSYPEHQIISACRRVGIDIARNPVPTNRLMVATRMGEEAPTPTCKDFREIRGLKIV